MAVSRAQMNDLLRRLEGPVRDAFARAIRTARGRANIAAIVRAIEIGDIGNALMLSAGIREGMWSSLTESIRAAYATTGAFIIAADLPKRFAMEFDISNPRAESWLRNNSAQLVTGNLMPEQRAAIQEALVNGMVKGQNPRTTALDIVGRMSSTGRRSGGVLGLTEQQVKFAVNMADDLENLNWQRYKKRVLRDKRFDSIVKRSVKTGKPLPKATRDKIVGRYKDRMLKHRGDTIARTETLQALNAASDEALRQIIDEGLVPKDAVIRIWRHSFGADERPGHLKMNGQERGIDELFLNPTTKISLKYPGGADLASEDVNCRCYLEHKIDFIAVELAA